MAGYAGSWRYSDGAFQALAEVRRRPRRRSRLVLFGRVSPRQLKFFADQAVVLPLVGHETYTAALGKLEPDMLIAPLDRFADVDVQVPCPSISTTRSPAPRGVYSDVPPYSRAVVDGKPACWFRR